MNEIKSNILPFLVVVEKSVDHGLHLQHTQDEKCLLLHQPINEIL